jgi:hypothetical protein
MASPPVSDLTAAFIRDGAPGENGPVLADLLGQGSFSVSGSVLTGDAILTGRTFARMIAAPERFYVEVHTEAQPPPGPGIARGGVTRVPGDVPPTNLRYDTPVVYETGTPIPDNVPSVEGGAVTAYGVEPPLPAGLELSAVTGIISGTPTEVAPSAIYTVTASNSAGSATAEIDITVEPGPPADLTYSTNPAVYVVGEPIAPNTPSNGGGTISEYEVTSPPGGLPDGLELDPDTGVLTGTPTTPSPEQGYEITGSNDAGSTSVLVVIRVDSSVQPPRDLTYESPVRYRTGYDIPPNRPSVGGGAVTGYTVSPQLPAGLSLHPTTGVISGKPTRETEARDYRVTASNEAGSSFFDVDIEVTLGSPKIDSYSNNPNNCYFGSPMPPMVPTMSGGAASSWSVSPALPLGMSIDGQGKISGTPLGLSGGDFTVTASNAAGSSSFKVTIVIYLGLP